MEQDKVFKLKLLHERKFVTPFSANLMVPGGQERLEIHQIFLPWPVESGASHRLARIKKLKIQS
jgi:hypothetical protein